MIVFSGSRAATRVCRFAALSLIFGLVFRGCTPAVEETAVVEAGVTQVKITPEYPVAEKDGDSYKAIKFNAVVEGQYLSAEDRRVKWEIVPGAGSVTKAGTRIDGDGVLTVDPDEESAALTVRAVSVPDRNRYGTATVTVKGIAFTDLAADGAAGEKTTAMLTLAFNREIPGGLSKENITLGGAGGVTAGTLSKKSASEYILTIGGVTGEGSLTVAVAKDGCTINPPFREAPVHYAPGTGTGSDPGTEPDPGEPGDSAAFAAVLHEDTEPPSVTWHRVTSGWVREEVVTSEDAGRITDFAVYEGGVFKIRKPDGDCPVRFYEVTGTGTTPVVVGSGVTGAVVLLNNAVILMPSGTNASPLDLEEGADYNLSLKNLCQTELFRGTHNTLNLF